MRRRARTRGPACALALVLALAASAGAHVPDPPRIWKAVAATNADARRGGPLEFQVELADAAGAVRASGSLRLDPAGTARLELTRLDGSVEVHERLGSGYGAQLDGAPLEDPRRLLPPVRLLQADRSDALESALRVLGGEPERVDLGIEAEQDCWVVGGRDPGPFEANGRTALWVSIESRQPLRIDEAGAGRYRLGPVAEFDAVRFPAWLEARTPGAPPLRLHVRASGPAPPAASAP